MTALIEPGPPALSSLSPDELRTWLAWAHGFSQQDLQANQAGRLSPAQQSSQINSALVVAGMLALLCLVSGSLFGCAIVTTLRGNEFSRTATEGLIFFAIAGTMWPVVLLGPNLLPKVVGQLLDGTQGQAQAAEGVVQTTTKRIWTHRGGRLSTIWYTVNGEQLEAPYNVSRQVAGLDGMRCRVYFAPHTKRVLSVEPS